MKIQVIQKPILLVTLFSILWLFAAIPTDANTNTSLNFVNSNDNIVSPLNSMDRGQILTRFKNEQLANNLPSAISPGDKNPLTPVLEVYPSSGQAPLTVLIKANNSTGKRGGNQEITSWAFDPTYNNANFNPIIFNPISSYTYDQPGTYIIRLQITDTPNTGSREAFAHAIITVTESTRDPGVQSQFPPNLWGAGINHVWATKDQVAIATDYLAPIDQIFMHWKNVEPNQHGVYNWSKLDNGLQKAAAQDRHISIQINSALPNWVFNHIAKIGTARNNPSPQFWDPDYIQYYKDLISALATHIASSPHKTRVAYIRHQRNAVHTETTFFDSKTNGSAKGTWVNNPAWNWPPDGHRYQVEWTEEIALNYEREIQSHFVSSFKPLDINVMLRVISSRLPENEQNTHFTNSSPIEGVQNTNITAMSWDGGTTYTRRFTIMRSFGAPGFEETKRNRTTSINLTPEQDIYGIILHSLHAGLPYIGIYGDDLIHVADNIEFQETFNFGNKYAGWHLYPKSAPGAWLALGEFKGSTSWKWYNTLTSQNWGYFLTQNNPNSTSTPLMQVGNPSSRFSFNARQIETTTTFDLNDAFAKAIRNEQVDVKVTYLANSGSFTVQADKNGTLQSLPENRRENHKGWRTVVFRINNPRFADGPDGKTDLTLIPTSGKPIVHMIEIDRLNPNSNLPPQDNNNPPF